MSGYTKHYINFFPFTYLFNRAGLRGGYIIFDNQGRMLDAKALIFNKHS
jgi:hypothetical protein